MATVFLREALFLSFFHFKTTVSSSLSPLQTTKVQTCKQISDITEAHVSFNCLSAKLLMAQITSQGGLNLLFNGDGSSFGVEPRDPFQYKLGSGLRSIGVHKRKLIRPRSGVWSSMNKKKSSKFSVDASLNVSGKGISGESEEYDSDEEFDELACFRGLVLDISYRQVQILFLCFGSFIHDSLLFFDKLVCFAMWTFAKF